MRDWLHQVGGAVLTVNCYGRPSLPWAAPSWASALNCVRKLAEYQPVSKPAISIFHGPHLKFLLEFLP